MNLQPTLSNHLITLRPLNLDDFEALYAVASDPLLWEQHPCYDRYKREVFEILFAKRLASKGALVVTDNQSGKIIGSSGYYELKEDSVVVGYTFLMRACWGGLYNLSLKQLMIEHALWSVPNIFFYIAEENVRSQRAIEKMGAVKINFFEKPKCEEAGRSVFVYKIERAPLLRKQRGHITKVLI